MLTLGKYMTGLLVESYGQCWRSTVLTAACYWPSSNCFPAQNFVSGSTELNRNRSPCVLHSDKRVRCHQSPLLFIVYMNWIDSHNRVDEGSQLGAAGSTVCFLRTIWYWLHPMKYEQGLQHAFDRFFTACDPVGVKISTKKTEVSCLSRNQRQCTPQGSGNSLKQIENFKYRGVVFTNDGRGNKEIDTRVGKANAVVRELHLSVVQNRSFQTVQMGLWTDPHGQQQFQIILHIKKGPSEVGDLITTLGHESWTMTEGVASPSGYIQAAQRLSDVQRPSVVIRSPTLLGPFLVRSQQNYLKLLLTVRYSESA